MEVEVGEGGWVGLVLELEEGVVEEVDEGEEVGGKGRPEGKG